ncbi:MAG: EamA family transporter [Brachymonas sp.]|nr:EamA family transporter [Brachymonas sp.]
MHTASDSALAPAATAPANPASTPSLAKPALSAMVLAALFACYVIWGSTYLAIRFALQGYAPFFQMAVRFFLAGGLIFAWVLWREGSAGLPSKRQWLHALIVAALMLGGGMGFVVHASKRINSGLIATFVAVVPMLTSLWGLLFRKLPTRLEILGMAVGLAGVAMLVRGSGFSSDPVGIALMAGSTACWSLGSVLSTTKFPLAPGAGGFASEMLCGGVLFTLLTLGAREPLPAWPLQLVPTAALLYLVVFGSIIGFSAYLYLLAHASPALATSYAFVNPVIALLLGMALGGERVTRWEWLATGVILGGVVLILAGKSRPAHRPDA